MLKKYAETRATDSLKAVHDMSQDNENTEVATQESDMIRSKVFNTYSIRSVLSVKL